MKSDGSAGVDFFRRQLKQPLPVGLEATPHAFARPAMPHAKRRCSPSAKEGLIHLPHETNARLRRGEPFRRQLKQPLPVSLEATRTATISHFEFLPAGRQQGASTTKMA